MRRMILKIVGPLLAIWLGFTAFGWSLAVAKTLVIIGLIAVVVFVIVWALARRSRRS